MTYENVVEKWKEKCINSIEDLECALNNYKILFAYHSNKIEDCNLTYHQTREIFENGRIMNYTGDLRDIYETQNQKDCYEATKENIINKTPITSEFICKVHYLLTKGCYDENRWKKGERPGKYKVNSYGVGDNIGLEPDEVEEEISFICNEIAGCGDDINEVLITAAYFHCNFENIHPFADGNGRTGRFLMNYILMTHGLPPTIIYDEDKETYYMGLTVFDKTDKLDGFVNFIKEQTVKTWSVPVPKKNRINKHLR